jgi:hypothetical protein
MGEKYAIDMASNVSYLIGELADALALADIPVILTLSEPTSNGKRNLLVNGKAAATLRPVS